MSRRFQPRVTAAELRANRQRILADDHEGAEVIDAMEDDDDLLGDDDDEEVSEAEGDEIDDDLGGDAEDDDDEDDDDDDAELDEALSLLESMDEDEADLDDEESDDDDADDDDADDVASMGIHGDDEEDDDEDDEIDLDDEDDDDDLELDAADLLSGEDEDDDAEGDEACGPGMTADSDDDDDDDDDEDVTGGDVSLTAEDSDDDDDSEDDGVDAGTQVSAEDDEEEDDDAEGDESMTYAEGDDDDEDDDAEDGEASPSGPTTQEIDGLEPGKPAPTTFFGPPPDAGSSYANYRCAGCDFEGMAARPKARVTAATRRNIVRHVEKVADARGIEITAEKTSGGMRIHLADGTPKGFKKLANAVSGSYDVVDSKKSSFVVSAGTQDVHCPCCATPMSMTARVRTASLHGMEMDLKPVGRCASHGTLYAANSDDVHVFCTVCASETISEGEDTVTVPVASPDEIEDNSNVEMTLHQADTQNPHWNVFANGTPLARIELQAQDRPMEIRDFFGTEDYRKATLGAIRSLGVRAAMKTQRATYYVAQANQAAEAKKVQKRLRKAAKRKVQAETGAYANDFINMLLVAHEGFEKNMFLDEGHPIKEAMAASLEDLGASDPISIVEDAFGDGVFAQYLEVVAAKADQMMQMDPMERRGQIRLIQGSAVQDVDNVPVTASAPSSRTLRDRLSRNSVGVRPSVSPRSRSASSASRKEELKRSLNLGGANVRGR